MLSLVWVYLLLMVCHGNQLIILSQFFNFLKNETCALELSCAESLLLLCGKRRGWLCPLALVALHTSNMAKMGDTWITCICILHLVGALGVLQAMVCVILLILILPLVIICCRQIILGINLMFGNAGGLRYSTACNASRAHTRAIPMHAHIDKTGQVRTHRPQIK